MTKQRVFQLGRPAGKWSKANKYPREISRIPHAARPLLALLLIAGLVSSWSCASHPKGELEAMRQVAIPFGIKNAQGQEVPRRALRAYITSGVHSIGNEKQYTTTHSALSKLPGVVSVRPGYGVCVHEPACGGSQRVRRRSGQSAPTGVCQWRFRGMGNAGSASITGPR